MNTGDSSSRAEAADPIGESGDGDGSITLPIFEGGG